MLCWSGNDSSTCTELGGNCISLYSSTDAVYLCDTVDGKNPAPPGMYKTFCSINNGINCLSTGAGFLPSTVS